MAFAQFLMLTAIHSFLVFPGLRNVWERGSTRVLKKIEFFSSKI